jgi:hypothetical protein
LEELTMARISAAVVVALLTVGTGPMVTGCSVGMAMSGSQNPDLGAIRVGATRGEIELHLGSPIKSTLLDDGHRADVYEYEIGNEPSAGRAAGHAVLDVLTLGIWEIAGTPIEGFQGEEYTATIYYDENDKVVDLRTLKASSSM